MHFARRKKESCAFRQYGGLSNLQSYGSAAGWREMLDELVKEEIAIKGFHGEEPVVKLVHTLRGSAALTAWKIHKTAIDRYEDGSTPPHRNYVCGAS